MRDPQEYEAAYLDNLGFEETLVVYRRRAVLAWLRRWRARRILEIGCGLTSLGEALPDFERLVVVEPCRQFYERALKRAAGDGRVVVWWTSLEEAVDRLGGEEFDAIVASSVLHEVQD